MDDVSGHWHLEETPSGRTRVFYACDIKLKGSVPGPILNYLSKSALKTATAWVKKESEKIRMTHGWRKSFTTRFRRVQASSQVPRRHACRLSFGAVVLVPKLKLVKCGDLLAGLFRQNVSDTILYRQTLH